MENLRNFIFDPQLLKEAMVNKDKVKVGTIRLLKSEIQREEGRVNSQLPNKRVINIIKSYIENITEVDGSSDEWKQEVSFLESLLPQQLSESQVDEILEQLINDGCNDMRQVMGTFTSKYGGQADGKLVSQLAQQKLSNL